MGRKIRVLRIINRFNIGGPTYNATFLSAFLSDKFETLLIGGLPEPGESDSLYIPEKYGVKPILIPELKRKPNFFTDRKALLEIKKIINEFQPDIVHTHASKAGALGRKAAFDCKVPVVVHTFHGHVFHSYFGKLKTWLYKTIEKRLAQKTSAIIAISQIQHAELTSKYKVAAKENTHVIPLGFDLNPFQIDLEEKRKNTRVNFGIEDDEIAIAIVGRLTAIKNHTFFIEAIEALYGRSTRKLKVFIVGDGEEKSALMAYCASKKSAQQFVFTSWVKDIAGFNPGMDIVCLCSFNEGTPVSLIEAQACNIPVVSTEVGGVQDIVEQNVSGLLSPSNDLEAYVNNLLKLVENENFRKKMSQNGWNNVYHKFGYERLVRDMEQLYLNLLKKKDVL